jgi:hypothetical protein
VQEYEREDRWRKSGEKRIADDVSYCISKILCGKFELISGTYKYQIPTLSNCDSFFKFSEAEIL